MKRPTKEQVPKKPKTYPDNPIGMKGQKMEVILKIVKVQMVNVKAKYNKSSELSAQKKSRSQKNL